MLSYGGFCATITLRKLIDVVPGGRNAGRIGAGRAGEASCQGFVAVHDAVRPLIPPGMLSKGLRACRRVGGGPTYGHPVTDTSSRSPATEVISTVDRSRLLAVQTRKFLPVWNCCAGPRAARRARIHVTDDANWSSDWALAPTGFPGPAPTSKLTTPEDMA